MLKLMAPLTEWAYQFGESVAQDSLQDAFLKRDAPYRGNEGFRGKE